MPVAIGYDTSNDDNQDWYNSCWVRVSYDVATGELKWHFDDAPKQEEIVWEV